MRSATTYATVSDMASRFNISEDAVYRRVSAGSWPASRIGRMIRFSPEQQEQIEQSVSDARPAGYRKDRIRLALQKLAS